MDDGEGLLFRSDCSPMLLKMSKLKANKLISPSVLFTLSNGPHHLNGCFVRFVWQCDCNISKHFSLRIKLNQRCHPGRHKNEKGKTKHKDDAATVRCASVPGNHPSATAPCTVHSRGLSLTTFYSVARQSFSCFAPTLWHLWPLIVRLPVRAKCPSVEECG